MKLPDGTVFQLKQDAENARREGIMNLFKLSQMPLYNGDHVSVEGQPFYNHFEWTKNSFLILNEAEVKSQVMLKYGTVPAKHLYANGILQYRDSDEPDAFYGVTSVSTLVTANHDLLSEVISTAITNVFSDEFEPE